MQGALGLAVSVQAVSVQAVSVQAASGPVVEVQKVLAEVKSILRALLKKLVGVGMG